MPTIDFTGRILFLSCDPEKLSEQLAGETLSLGDASPLRDDVSTDEITPLPVLVHFDGKIGRFPYIGFKAGEDRPIGENAVRQGGFSVTVAGARYGKGSSREHSPLAEYSAGIRLVIAESFERVYRQNADNIGLFTSTDFSLVERIQRGEAIDLDELLGSRDRLASEILQHGGLLRYGQQRMTAISTARTIRQTPRTLAQKILDRHAIRSGGTDPDLVAGDGGFVRADWRFIHEYHTGMCAHMLHETVGRPAAMHEPETIVAFQDHLSYAHRSEVHRENDLLPRVRRLSDAHREFVSLYGIPSHGYLPSGEGSEGICHAIMAEYYALPGQVVAGTDSHTPHSGALGCLAFGVGTTDMANSMLTGAVRLTIPDTLRIELAGPVPPGVTAKDVILHLLADRRLRSGAAAGKVVEFTGTAIGRFSTDERATLTNMTAELGAFAGIVAPDGETVRFLEERRGIRFDLQPWMLSDEDAHFADTITVDCARLGPMAAAPGDPGNGIPLDRIEEPVRIDIAYGGSCTAGKREDFDRYFEVLSWAAANGLKAHPKVQLYLQFGTTAVKEYCIERGYLDVFEQVGAEILQPACGACGNCGPGSSTRPDQVTVSAINRNFPGRSGPGQVWLASAPTVAASAIAGELISFADLQSRFAG